MTRRGKWVVATGFLAAIVCGGVLRADSNDAPATQPATDPSKQKPVATAKPVGVTTGPQAYSALRWDENYHYLADPAARHDLFDPIKYIPLNASGDWYLTLGGEARDRYENFQHDRLGSGPQTRDGYNLFRFLPYADVHLGQYVRGFVQFRTALEGGREGGPRARDMDTADLQQGFVELDVPLAEQLRMEVKVGRQQMAFGRERLIGVSYWTNAERNYDAARATFISPHNTLDVFYFRPVQVEKYTWDNNDGRTNFSAIYDTMALPGVFETAKTTLSLYGFALNTNHVSKYADFAGTGSENRYTIGSELSARPGDWDLDLEVDYQLGNFADPTIGRNQSIGAFSIATEEGYTFKGMGMTPHLFVGFDLATGDHNPNNGHLGTFNQLFPTAHNFFGYMDYIGRQNIVQVHPGVDLTLAKHKRYAQNVILRTEYHQLWRESVRDAVYDASGAVLRPGTASRSRSIGGELDLLINWQIDQHLSAYGGYSHFFAGTFIHDTGPSYDSDFFYTAVNYAF